MILTLDHFPFFCLDVIDGSDQPNELLDFVTSNSEGQFLLLWMAIGLTLAMYAGLIAFGLHNFFKYIVK